MSARSLGETEALARKAARGAGFDWGMAEEAGHAVRWLCSFGFKGADALAALLDESRGASRDARAPVTGERWRAREGLLCPIAAGVAFADRAGWGQPRVSFVDLSRPLLLVPFVASAATQSGETLRLEWSGASIDLARGRIGLNETGALDVAVAALAVCRIAAGPPGCPTRRGYRAEMEADAAAVLEGYAARTYAPTTAESRATGAGAGLLDND